MEFFKRGNDGGLELWIVSFVTTGQKLKLCIKLKLSNIPQGMKENRKSKTSSQSVPYKPLNCGESSISNYAGRRSRSLCWGLGSWAGRRIHLAPTGGGFRLILKAELFPNEDLAGTAILQ